MLTFTPDNADVKRAEALLKADLPGGMVQPEPVKENACRDPFCSCPSLKTLYVELKIAIAALENEGFPDIEIPQSLMNQFEFKIVSSEGGDIEGAILKKLDEKDAAAKTEFRDLIQRVTRNDS